jgi:hypothetical protein
MLLFMNVLFISSSYPAEMADFSRVLAQCGARAVEPSAKGLNIVSGIRSQAFRTGLSRRLWPRYGVAFLMMSLHHRHRSLADGEAYFARDAIPVVRG